MASIVNGTSRNVIAVPCSPKRFGVWVWSVGAGAVTGAHTVNRMDDL
jgi:hypothetical protein